MSKPIHILIVDDDPMILRLFSSQLAEAGFEVMPAHDGNEGREMARRFQPDLILLDVRMPVMDGFETLSRLKNEEPTKHIPVIFLTNEDFSIDAQKAWKELGADDYIPKSTPRGTIISRINAVLTRYGHEVSETKPDNDEGLTGAKQ